MNRRQLGLRALLAGSVVSGRSAITLGQQEDPGDVGEPIELAPGFSLVDHRFVDLRRASVVFVGDYLNETGSTFDAPVLGMTFFDKEGNVVGSAYATPELLVSVDGERTPLIGTLDEFSPFRDEYDRVEYAICDSLDGTFWTEEALALDLALEDIEEEIDLDEETYRVSGKVRNNGEVEAEYVAVTAIFRNEDGLFSGSSSEQLERPIPPGKTFTFKFDTNITTYSTLDPFNIADGEPITSELSVGLPASVFLISC